jgi:hypothetical protein
MQHTLHTIVLFVAIGFALSGCSKDDTSEVKPQFTGQQETFPGVIKEDWYFYNNKGDLTVNEVFTHKYENGKRISSGYYRSKEVQIKDTIIKLINKDTTIQKYRTTAAMFAEIKYNYNDKGNLIIENWQVKPAPPAVSWVLTYQYNNEGTKIIGGGVTGQMFNSSFIYSYDSQGRRSKTTMTYSPTLYWTLSYKYNEDNKCIMASGNESDGRHIVVLYRY